MEVILDFVQAFKLSADGWQFMWLMLFMGALATGIALERFIYLGIKCNINAPKFMDKIFKMVKANKIDEAVKLCQGTSASLPKVVRGGLEAAATTQRAIQNNMDEATLEVMGPLEKRLNYLNLIANTSTMVGLMGTIFGLVLSFKAVGNPAIPADQKGAMLAAGIATAMNTTLFGLLVAVPVTVVYTILMTKQSKIVDEIDEYSVKLINLLGSR